MIVVLWKTCFHYLLDLGSVAFESLKLLFRPFAKIRNGRWEFIRTDYRLPIVRINPHLLNIHLHVIQPSGIQFTVSIIVDDEKEEILSRGKRSL